MKVWGEHGKLRMEFQDPEAQSPPTLTLPRISLLPGVGGWWGDGVLGSQLNAGLDASCSGAWNQRGAPNVTL